MIKVNEVSMIQNIWVTENGVKNLYLRYGSHDGPTWFHMGMSGHRTMAGNQKELEEAYQRWVHGE